MPRGLTPIRSRPAGWRRRRLRKFERRRARRALRIIEACNANRVKGLHRAGERAIARLFDGPGRVYFGERSGDQTGGGKPVRLRPGVPPVRDAEHQAKHRTRKLARTARKRNRA